MKQYHPIRVIRMKTGNRLSRRKKAREACTPSGTSGGKGGTPMKRMIGSLFLALAMVLGLVPLTAFAADGTPALLVVGGTEVTEESYWTTDTKGQLATASKTEDWNVRYEPDTATLTLRNAKIQTSAAQTSGNGAGIYAQGGEDGGVALTLVLRGENQVSGSSHGIFLVTSQEGRNPRLTIQGPGSLEVRGGKGAGDVSICLQSGLNPAGQWGTAEGTAALALKNNALVQAWDGVDTNVKTGLTPTGGKAAAGGGILFDQEEGTVYGAMTLQKDLELGPDQTLDLGPDAQLDTGKYQVLVEGGTLSPELIQTLGEGAKIAVTGVTVKPTSLNLEPGATAELEITVSPENANDRAFSCKADPEGIVSVELKQPAGTVELKGLKPGKTTVTVTTHDGNKTATCQVTVAHEKLVKTAAQAATCTNPGNTEYWYCEGCKKYFSDADGTKEISQEKTVIPATGHSWGDPAWSWSADGKSCTVTFTCKNDGSHKESPAVTVTSAVQTPATCQAKGTTRYTATVTFNGKTYTTTKDVTDIPLADHVAQWVGDYPATCDRNGREGTATCVVCGKVLVEDKVIPAPGHKYGDPVWTWSKDGKSCTATFTCSVCGEKSVNQATVTTKTVTQPTCTQAGSGTRQAQVTFNGNTYTSTQGTVTLAALGHDYKNGKCTRCGASNTSSQSTASTAKITAGAAASWRKESDQGLSFTYEGEGKLAQVQVNGATLEESNYTLQGTTVTLTPEYLNSLETGSYTLVISLEKSSAKTTFTVAPAATPTPAATVQPTATPEPEASSGLEGSLILWIALGVGVLALAVLLFLLKPWARR